MTTFKNDGDKRFRRQQDNEMTAVRQQAQRQRRTVSPSISFVRITFRDSILCLLIILHVICISGTRTIDDKSNNKNNDENRWLQQIDAQECSSIISMCFNNPSFNVSCGCNVTGQLVADQTFTLQAICEFGQDVCSSTPAVTDAQGNLSYYYGDGPECGRPRVVGQLQVQNFTTTMYTEICVMDMTMAAYANATSTSNITVTTVPALRQSEPTLCVRGEYCAAQPTNTNFELCGCQATWGGSSCQSCTICSNNNTSSSSSTSSYSIPSIQFDCTNVANAPADAVRSECVLFDNQFFNAGVDTAGSFTLSFLDATHRTMVPFIPDLGTGLTAILPTGSPTMAPTSAAPTTKAPTRKPTLAPTRAPTSAPTRIPTAAPTTVAKTTIEFPWIIKNKKGIRAINVTKQQKQVLVDTVESLAQTLVRDQQQTQTGRALQTAQQEQQELRYSRRRRLASETYVPGSASVTLSDASCLDGLDTAQSMDCMLVSSSFMLEVVPADRAPVATQDYTQQATAYANNGAKMQKLLEQSDSNTPFTAASEKTPDNSKGSGAAAVFDRTCRWMSLTMAAGAMIPMLLILPF